MERVGRSVELIANFERHAPRFTQPPAYLSVFCHIPTKLPYYIVLLYCIVPSVPTSYLPVLPLTSRPYLLPSGPTSYLNGPTSYLGNSLSTYFIYLVFLPVYLLMYPPTRLPIYFRNRWIANRLLFIFNREV